MYTVLALLLHCLTSSPALKNDFFSFFFFWQVGLQTSSSVTAFGQSADGIAVRRSCKDTSEWVGRMFQKYFWSNLLNSSIISMQLFMIVAVADKTECKWPHAFIIACGAMVNMLIGNLMGILSPTLAGDVCRLDPSAFAGPLETALQVGEIFRTTFQKIGDNCPLQSAFLIHSIFVSICVI